MIKASHKPFTNLVNISNTAHRGAKNKSLHGHSPQETFGEEVIIQIDQQTDEATSARGGFNSSVGREPLKLIIHRQLKIKALHDGAFLESRLCAFGLHSLGGDFEISFMVVACLLSKCPCCLNTVRSKAEPLLLKVLTFFSLLCLWEPDPQPPPLTPTAAWRPTMREEATMGRLFHQLHRSRHTHH